MPIAFENGNRNKAVPVEDRSPSLAPSVTVTLEQSSLPDRPQEKDGIIIQEEIPSGNKPDEIALRTFSVPRTKGKVLPLHNFQPARPLDWKRGWNKDGPRLNVKGYDAKYRQPMILQSRGQRQEGDSKCRPCKSGKGPFRSCVVDQTDDKIGLGACANCIWAKRGHECNLKVQDIQTFSSDSGGSGDDIPARPPPSPETKKMSKIDRGTSRHGLGLPAHSKLKPASLQKNDFVQKFLTGSQLDQEPESSPPPEFHGEIDIRHTIECGHSPHRTGSLLMEDATPTLGKESGTSMARDQHSILSVSAGGDQLNKRGDIISHIDHGRLDSRRVLPKLFPNQQQSQRLSTAPENRARNDENGLQQGNERQATRHHETNHNEVSRIIPGENEVPQKAGNVEFFKIPEHLSAKSIPDIERAIQELELLKTRLGKRKRLLEAAERDSFD